jgi:hypothetical protein
VYGIAPALATQLARVIDKNFTGHDLFGINVYYYVLR